MRHGNAAGELEVMMGSFTVKGNNIVSLGWRLSLH